MTERVRAVRPVAFMPKPADWAYAVEEARAMGRCAKCGKKHADVFKDVLSTREYQLSGMCQECQDAFYDYPDSATRPDLHDYGPR